MVETIPTCVNHPDTETRLACSSCEDPICVRCMRPAAVGQKCPRCAKMPRSARALGKPSHYVKATAAGLGAAIGGGIALGLLFSQISLFGIILSAMLGFGVGRAVGWGAQRQTAQPFVVIAVTMAVVAVTVSLMTVAGLRTGFSTLLFRPQPFTLLSYLAAGWFALRGLRG
ncbi:MAG TPA: hypothetical protein VML96_05535 [Egibacteraceae bacterium]|nr:hypothetical protein [Egibacteraceae bacterium]